MTTLSPLSDVDGRITHIFLALPSYDKLLIDPLLACFGGIRDALGRDVRCTILRHAAQANLVHELLNAHGDLDALTWGEGFVLRLRDTENRVEGRTLQVATMAFPDFTNWVQDAFVVGIGGAGGARLWASPRVRRRRGGWDDAVARKLTAHLGWTHAQLPCAVEAGNVLVDADVVIGADVPRTTSPENWQSLIELLSGAGRSVFVPAPELPQPVFHLDLYVTLAGTDPKTQQPRALVGSVRLARELLGQRAAETDPDDGLDAVARDMTVRGYAVERLPLLPFASTVVQDFAYYTYNNCLVEIWRGDDGATRRRVTLPTYSWDGDSALETLDAKAARTWASLDFEVRTVRGAFAYVADLGGSLRCMTKVLARCP